MQKDNYLTVSQAADFMQCTKDAIKELVRKGKLTPIKARPNDYRYTLSMREVNRLFNKVKL